MPAYLHQRCPITKHPPKSAKKMKKALMDVPNICIVCIIALCIHSIL